MALKREELAHVVDEEMESREIRTEESVSSSESMRVYHVRFRPSEWNRMKHHFESEGLNVSAGIRMALARYMKEQGLR